MTTVLRRAGMTSGTPDWQADRMYETDTAAMLEKAYAEDDFPFSNVESEFSTARYFIGQAVCHLVRAANYADPYGKADPIDDLIDRLEDGYESDMDAVLKKLKG